MDVKEFGNELKRMFKSLGGKPNEWGICDGIACSECPFNVVKQGCTVCTLYSGRIDEVIDVVTAWSAEHPKETNKEVFLKVFPNADLFEDGVPKSCANLLGLVPDRDDCSSCIECWNSEYKGVDVERLGVIQNDYSNNNYRNM